MPSSVDSNEDDFDGRFDDLHRLIGDYGSAVAVSADLAAKGRAGANDCYALEKQARISLKSALLARLHPAPTAADTGLVERLAQWLHDEVHYPEFNFPDHSWPVHPNDTGQREDGWLKIVPPDVCEQFRDIARRLPVTASTQQLAAAREQIAAAEADGDRMLNAERDAHIETSQQGLAIALQLRAALSSAHETIRATLDAIEEIPEYNTSDYEKIRLILAAVKRTRAALTLAAKGPRHD